MDHSVEKIIKINNYITLATIDSSGLCPLVTPVFFANNIDFTNFYWVSSVTSQHSQNIEYNSQISAVIFDSSAQIGDGFGIFMIGTCNIITNHDEIKFADD